MPRLENQLSRETVEVGILEAALVKTRGRDPSSLARSPLGVFRSHLLGRLQESTKPRRRSQKADDAALVPL